MAAQLENVLNRRFIAPQSDFPAPQGPPQRSDWPPFAALQRSKIWPVGALFPGLRQVPGVSANLALSPVLRLTRARPSPVLASSGSSIWGPQPALESDLGASLTAALQLAAPRSAIGSTRARQTRQPAAQPPPDLVQISSRSRPAPPGPLKVASGPVLAPPDLLLGPLYGPSLGARSRLARTTQRHQDARRQASPPYGAQLRQVRHSFRTWHLHIG